MSDKDVDAQFADIVAHWDDAPVEPERAPRPTAADRPATRPRRRAGRARARRYVAPHDHRRRRRPRRAAPGPPPSRRADPPPRPAGPLPGRFRFAAPAGSAARGRRAGRAAADLAVAESPWSDARGALRARPAPHRCRVGGPAVLGLLVGLVGGPLLLLFLVLFDRDVQRCVDAGRARPAVAGASSCSSRACRATATTTRRRRRASRHLRRSSPAPGTSRSTQTGRWSVAATTSAGSGRRPRVARTLQAGRRRRHVEPRGGAGAR